MKDETLVRFNAFRQLCLKNAEDALRAAEELLGKNVNHIAYHISILALEEVGKIFMSWMQYNKKEDWSRESTKLAMDDHVKKLFYAIWGPSIGRELITKSQLADNQFMASTLHKKRLASLYGDVTDTIESSLKIGDSEVQSLINFTRARLELSQIDGEVKEDPEPNPNMEWLDQFMQLPGKRNYIFGKEVQEKLIELGDVNEWLEWLKYSFEHEQKNLSELMEKEFNRSIPSDSGEIKSKWEITFTIRTPSHSVRANILSAVNKKIDRPIKLFAGKDKHTLIIKNILGSNVSIDDLWERGWISCKLFVASLCIASNGVFYWNTVTDIDKYHDYITDLENDKKLDARLQTRLTLNWQDKKMYLSEENIHLAFIVYEYFIQLKEHDMTKPVVDYMVALGMLAKTDIHLRLESSAFDRFYEAFYHAVQRNEKLGPETDIHEIGFYQIEGMLKGRDEFDKTMKIAKELRENKGTSEPVTLREVIAMKQYCGIYLLTLAARKLHRDDKIRLVPTDKDASN